MSHCTLQIWLANFLGFTFRIFQIRIKAKDFIERSNEMILHDFFLREKIKDYPWDYKLILTHVRKNIQIVISTQLWLLFWSFFHNGQGFTGHKRREICAFQCSTAASLWNYGICETNNCIWCFLCSVPGSLHCHEV